MNAQMQRLAEMAEKGASRKSWVEEYQETLAIANQLGLSKPEGASDIKAQIELKRLDFEQTTELKRMAREEKRADREFQLKLKQYDDEKQCGSQIQSDHLGHAPCRS